MTTDIKFQCAECGQNILVDASAAGMQLDCPHCRTHVTVPKIGGLNDRSYLAAEEQTLERDGLDAKATALAGRDTLAHSMNGSTHPSSNGTTNGNGHFAEPEVAVLQQDLAEASASSARMESELNEAQAEILRLRAELEAGEAHATRVAAELKKAYADAQTTHKQLKERERELANAANQIAELGNERDVANAHALQVQSVLDDANREIAGASAQIAESEQQIEALSTQVRERDIEIAETRELLAGSQAERTAAFREIEQWNEHSAGLDAELATARAELATAARVEAAFHESEASLAEARRELAATAESAEALRICTEELRAECGILRRSLSENETGRELIEVRERLGVVTRERNDFADRAGRLDTVLNQAEVARDEFSEQIKVLRRELEEERRRAESNSEVRLRQDNEVLRGIIARQNTELEQKHAELKRLRRARFGVRLAYAVFAILLIAMAIWAVKTVPALGLEKLLQFGDGSQP